MPDMIKDAILGLLGEYWHYAAMAVVGIAVAGSLLGWLKNLAGALFKASLSLGEAGATQVVKRPKAVGMAAALFAVWMIGMWAWHTFTAEKIVIKEVPVTVTDNAMIEHLKGQLAEAESVKAAAEAASESARRQAEAEAKAKHEAENLATKLAAEVEALSPQGDEAKLAVLERSIDTLHANGVVEELNFLSKHSKGQQHDREALRYTETYHPGWRNHSVNYHRDCHTCERNFAAAKDISDIKIRQMRARQAEERAIADAKARAGGERRQRRNELFAAYDGEHSRKPYQEFKQGVSGTYSIPVPGDLPLRYHLNCEKCKKNRSIDVEMATLRN